MKNTDSQEDKESQTKKVGKIIFGKSEEKITLDLRYF